MPISTDHILHLASILSAIAPIAAGRRVRNVLWYYAILSIICDTFGFLHLVKAYRHWYANLYLAAEFLLTSRYIIDAVITGSRRRLVWFAAVLIAALFLASSWSAGFWNANFKGGALLYSLMIPLTMLGFYHILKDLQLPRIEESPVFIFCAAYLLYVAGSFLIMLFVSRLVSTDQHLLRTLWLSIHDILNLIKNLAMAYSLHLMTKKKAR